ncbi:MAG: hypothetical protein QXP04_01560, partial [Candidatus Nanoarchaeia archaeon]|nr:hypothetical protein [Candidatus Jingweiarchaeum tengchongense]
NWNESGEYTFVASTENFSTIEHINFISLSETQNGLATGQDTTTEISKNQSILEQEQVQVGEQRIEIKLPKKSFKIGEKINFEILTNENITKWLGKLRVILIDPEGNETQIRFNELRKEFLIDTSRNFKPGLYKLRLMLLDKILSESEFSVGLVNINTPKSIYLVGEETKIIVGVLNKYGHRVPDASISLKIITPSGKIEEFSTNDGIISNGDGTYNLTYYPEEIGIYKIYARAIWEDVDADYETIFEVRESVEFDILRESETVIYPEPPTKMKIYIKPYLNASSVKIIEPIPDDFIITQTNGIVIQNESGKFILWEYENPSDNVILEYTYKTPQISPMLYLVGPLHIDYIQDSEAKSFEEVRPWSIAVDTIFYYYVKWTWRWRDTSNITDTLTVCRGEYYNVSVQVVDAAYDSASSAQILRLQLLPGGASTYNNLPYAGWTYWGGDTNDHSVSNELSNAALTCTNGVADACYFETRLLNITNDAATGTYKLKLTSSVYPGAFRENTNILTVRVINCTNANLVRDIKIYSPTGEDQKIIRGHIAFIAVPLANYNTTASVSGNVTVSLWDGDTQLDWFFWDNTTKPFSIGATSTIPYWNESILTWRFEVPEDIPQKTYTLKVEINQTNRPTLTYTKTFDIYQSEEGNLAPLIIFTTYPNRGTGDSGSRNYQRLSVCNFGDYNLTVNITVYPSGQSPSTAPTIIEGPSANTITASLVQWLNREIPTSSCFNATIQWVGPEEASADGQFVTEVVWVDPVTQSSQTITKTDTFISANAATGHSGSPDPFLNITEIGESSSATIQYAIRTGSATAGYVYVIDLWIPPGFNISRDSFSGGYTPDPGYPVGSMYEGWWIRWSRLGAFTNGYITTSTTIGGLVTISNIQTTIGSILQFAPGGKPWYQNLLGEAARNKGEWWTKNKRTITLLGPWIKTIRNYYDASSSQWLIGFPSSFGCGTFNVSFQVFNKGNQPGSNFNFTENKENLTVTHPQDLIFQNTWSSEGSPATINDSVKITWDNNINFQSPYGKPYSKYYNYTLNVTYQTNGTFRFQAIPLNGTLIYYNKPYIFSASCGASLNVSKPTTIPSTIYAGDVFNISSTIYNAGPGNASNVIVEINYTGKFEVRNSTNEISNLTYLGTIGPLQSRNAHTDYTYIVNTSGTTPGTYTFCIKANATENSTIVFNCKDVQVLAPPASIEMENATIVSNETGSSSGAWGFNFTFNITVRVSNSENNVSVCAWFSKTGSEPWKQVGNCQIYQAPGSGTGQWTNFTFEFDPDCEDIGSTVFAKFNATNDAGTTNSTTKTFTITKDKTIFEDVIGNNTETRRGKTTTLLALRVRDANGTLITNLPITFYVTLDGSIYDVGTSNTTNSSAYANYYFQAKCSPKYQVGNQKWKAVISGQACYEDNSTENYYNLSILVTGDINLDFQKPDGSTNYTQEQKIPFLGATTDDCGDPLSTNVKFYANHSTAGYECSPVSQVGANAYTCDWNTNVTTPKGWYNTTMYAEANYYYSNVSYRLISPGLFYLFPIYKLENPSVIPSSQGWGYKNWNFSIISSSGDTDSYEVKLLLAKGSPTGFTECSDCVNQTPLNCSYPDCINQTKYWYKNFTSQDVGTWFYMFSLATESTSGYDSFVIKKDNTSIEYVSGNNSYANLTQAATFKVRVKDLIADTYNLTPATTVYFNVSYDGIYNYLVNSTTTDTNGIATVTFTPNCNFNPGAQKWFAWISEDSAYYSNISENFTITIDVTGCEPQPTIVEALSPIEVFQYNNFTINATISSLVSTSNDVYVTLNAPSEWQVDNRTKYIGSIGVGELKKVKWTINATTYGNFSISIYVNNSLGNDDTEYVNPIVWGYKYLGCPNARLTLKGIDVTSKVCSLDGVIGNDFDNESAEAKVDPGESILLEWDCGAIEPRVADIKIFWEALNGTANAVIIGYGKKEWFTVASTQIVTENITMKPLGPLGPDVGLFNNGSCGLQLRNYGPEPLMIDYVNASIYMIERVVVTDVTYLRSDDTVNMVISIKNPFNEWYNDTLLSINITNWDGNVSYYENSTYLNLTPNSLINYTFLVNTLNMPHEMLVVNTTLNFSDGNSTTRFERFYNIPEQVYLTLNPRMCPGTSETLNVELEGIHADENTIINVSVSVPPGWDVSPGYLEYVIFTPEDIKFEFNITSPNNAENATINVSISYLQEFLEFNITKLYQLNVSNANHSVIEVIRETPTRVYPNGVFESALVLHNKGCAPINGNVILKEEIKPGWTPANPNLLGGLNFNSSVDLENNLVIWQIAGFDVNEYGVATYQVKAPTTIGATGNMKWNLNYENVDWDEPHEFHHLQTANYTNESHIEFDLALWQLPDFPWNEPRSLQPNYTYNASLIVRNIGDTQANNWTIYLPIPGICDVTQVWNGSWNSSTRTIEWNLSNLNVRNTTYLNFTINCSSEGGIVLNPYAIKDTRGTINYTDYPNYVCSGASCDKTIYHTLQSPNKNYQRIINGGINFTFNATGENLTISELSIKTETDDNVESLFFERNFFGSIYFEYETIYNLTEDQSWRFRQLQHPLYLHSYATGTYGANTTSNITKIYYTWLYGLLFNETQHLFMKVKEYSYAPLLENATLYVNGNPSLTTGGWGEQFNFSVMVKDRFGRNVTVYAWHKKGVEDYNLIGSWECVNCASWTQANFSYDYSHLNISDNWYFKFNATNVDGSTEIGGYNFKVEKDDIDVINITPSWNENINRSTPYNFTLEIYDRDNQTPATLLEFGKGFIQISQFGSNTTYKTYYPQSPVVNESGYMTQTMTLSDWCPTANNFYLGQNYWKGGAIDSSYYNNNLTEPSPYNALPFWLMGDLSNSTIQSFNQNFTRGQTIAFSGSVIDDCSVTQTDPSKFGLEFRMMQNGNVYGTCITTTGFSCQIETNSSFPYGWYNVTMIAFGKGENGNKYWNGTKNILNAFFLASNISLTNPQVQPHPEGSWEIKPFNFSLIVTSEDNQNVTIMLWLKNTTYNWFLENSTSCVNCNNFDYSYQKNFSCDNIDNWYFKFNAS